MMFSKARYLPLILCLLCLGVSCSLIAQKSIVERLGYTAEDKLLIIHADDLGMAHGENRASFLAMTKGAVNSASIMVPCPWLLEVAEFSKQNPGKDLGIHLTVTSEWENYKWGPVAGASAVPSLVDANGWFYDNCEDFIQNAKPVEVERELVAQIERAKSVGLDPSHLDTHMGCLIYHPSFFEIYVRLGREYGIPSMLSHDELESVDPVYLKNLVPGDIFIDRIVSASPEDYLGGMSAFYEKVLRNLKPGITALLIHTAFDTPEMQGATVNHPDWGAAWRQADFDYFISGKCQSTLQEENIHLITWREIGQQMKK